MKRLSLSIVAALVMTAPAFAVCAVPSDTFVQRFGATWCEVPTISPMGGGPSPVRRAPAPVPPTSVPATPLTPATPAPGVYNGTLVGTPLEGTPAGSYPGYVVYSDFTLANGDVIPAGTYDAIVAPNGMFVAKAR